jgi:prophage DNA circulation protein
MSLTDQPSANQDIVNAFTGPRGATVITQLASGFAWRQYLQPASFRGVRFYVDTSVRESARRIVPHEFPKRDVPYAEDMGRKARGFTVRGYLIVYPREGKDNELQRRNYIPQRDKLIFALETEGPADLQLPLLGVLNCACSGYRVTEDDKLGGFCQFDMTFIEFGQAPSTGTRDSKAGVYYAAQTLGNATQQNITDTTKAISDGSATVTADGRVEA